ncbi:MAG: hypothetical protein IJP94_07585, partial [Clostridia bacterium]|nr:hypothetical protein [Clostridia bacterium]
MPMVSTGFTHTLALREDGTLWAWGRNANGELGDGTTQGRTFPVRVKSSDVGSFVDGHVVKVFAGNGTSFALDDEGYLWSWGSNSNYYLAHGSLTSVDGQKAQLVAYQYQDTETTTTGEGENAVTTTKVVTKQAPLKNVVKMAFGENHIVALTADGIIWTWGEGQRGQLGHNSSDDRAVAERVYYVNSDELFENIVDIAAGYETSYAVTKDGQVYAWGENGNGASYGYGLGYLGIGNNTDRYKPYKVLAADYLLSSVVNTQEEKYIQNVFTIDSGDEHAAAIALDVTGTGPAASRTRRIYTWGYGATNRTNNGSTNLYHPTEKVIIAEEPANIYAFYHGTATLTTDGKIYSWGEDGTASTAVAELSRGEMADGDEIWYMESNNNGVNASVFTGNKTHTRGYIYSWGSTNENGQLGDDTAGASAIPIQTGDRETRILELYGIKVNGDSASEDTDRRTGYTEADTKQFDVYIRVTEGQSIEIDLDKAKEEYYEGFNFFNEYQLTENKLDGSTRNYDPDDFVFVSSNDSVATVAHDAANKNKVIVTPKAGEKYNRGGETVISYIDKNTGAQGAFVLNVYGGRKTANSASEDGSGYTEQKASPLVSSSANHTIALKYDGKVYAWGSNNKGQIAPNNSAQTTFDTPQKIQRPLTAAEMEAAGITETAFTDLTDVIGIAAGGAHSLAVDKDGHVWAWGDNTYGQIGNGGYGTDHVNATLVMLNETDVMENIVGVAAGQYFSMALRADGYVYTWGRNTDTANTKKYQLGSSSTEGGEFVAEKDKAYPIMVTQGTYASGVKKTIEDGKIVAVKDTYGNDAPDELLNNVVMITAGTDFAAALRRDGTVYAWGNNANGQGGAKNDAVRMAPYQIVSGAYDATKNAAYDTATELVKTSRFHKDYIGNVSRIAAGDAHLLMLTSKLYNEETTNENTNVYGIGNSTYSQLGGAANSKVTSPVLIASPKSISKTTGTSGDARYDRSVDYILNIAGGANHTVMLAQSKTFQVGGSDYPYSLWSVGRNNAITRDPSTKKITGGTGGQLGLNKDNSYNQTTPAQLVATTVKDEENDGTTDVIPYFEGTLTLSAGGNSISVVNDEGKVYMCGDNDTYQIGNYYNTASPVLTLVGEPEFKSIIFKNVHVVKDGVSVQYYPTAPQFLDIRQDQLLYIDVNQLFNRYFKGFTLLTDTEEHVVSKFAMDGTMDSVTNTPAYVYSGSEEEIYSGTTTWK